MKKKLLVLFALSNMIGVVHSQTLFVPNGFTSSGIGSALVPNNGNVGIRTNNPLKDLQIGGSTSGDRCIRLFDSQHSWDITHISSNNRFSLWYDGIEKITILPTGLVGIRTTNPQNDLQIGGSVPSSPGIRLFDSNHSWDINHISSNNRFSFLYDGTEKITILPNGAVGIGTTNPLKDLQIGGSSPNNPGIRLFDSNHSWDIIHTSSNNRFSLWYDGAEKITFSSNGYVGIGTNTPGTALDVVGIIRAQEVKVCLNQGCDFVFDKGYKLRSIDELDKFVKENNHLPEIAPAKEMESNGINVSEMNAKLLQKIEEQTLYIIELNRQVQELKKKMEELKK